NDLCVRLLEASLRHSSSSALRLDAPAPLGDGTMSITRDRPVRWQTSPPPPPVPRPTMMDTGTLRDQPQVPQPERTLRQEARDETTQDRPLELNLESAVGVPKEEPLGEAYQESEAPGEVAGGTGVPDATAGAEDVAEGGNGAEPPAEVEKVADGNLDH